MEKRSLFIFIIVSFCILSAYVILLNVKFSFQVELPVKFQEINLGIQNITSSLGCIDAEIEYSDDDCIIYGMCTHLLPIRSGYKINLQGALRKCDDFTTLIIGYPALPLESY